MSNALFIALFVGVFAIACAAVILIDRRRRRRQAMRAAQPAREPTWVALRIVDAAGIRIIDARQFPKELVWNQELFRAVASQQARLEPLSAQLWIFADPVLRAIADLDEAARAVVLRHLRDGRRTAGPDLIYGKSGVLDERQQAAIREFAELATDMTVVTPEGRIGVEEILRRSAN